MNNKLVNRLIPAVFLAAALSGEAFSADAQHGRRLAMQWCAACHFVENGRAAPDIGPPFSQMANDPAYSNERLRGWLHDPHPPMPKLDLSRPMIDDIIAFIRTLKN